MDKKQQESQYNGILSKAFQVTRIIPKIYLYIKVALFVYEKNGFVHFQA